MIRSVPFCRIPYVSDDEEYDDIDPDTAAEIAQVDAMFDRSKPGATVAGLRRLSPLMFGALVLACVGSPTRGDDK